MELQELRVKLYAMKEPAILLEDGRILTYESLCDLEHEDFLAIAESCTNLIVDRVLIPDSVTPLNIGDYLKLAHEVVNDNARYLEKPADLYEVVAAVVEDENGHIPKKDIFEDYFEGIYNDYETFAHERFEELVLPEVPDYLHEYLDEEKWTISLEWDFRVYDLPYGQVAIFHN